MDWPSVVEIRVAYPVEDQRIAAVIYHSLIDLKSELNSSKSIDQLKRAFIAANSIQRRHVSRLYIHCVF